MRGRGPPGVGNGDEDPASKDSIIQGTDSDALGSRLSAVNAGYLQDPYIRHFYTDGIPPTRFPIINRGMQFCPKVHKSDVDTFVRHLCQNESN
jgi:hypothetical protein